MKFRFCGDSDCPDWVLAEISVLSKMTLLKIRLLVTQIVNYIICNKINYEVIEKIAKDAKFENSEVKAGVAAIAFILKNAIRNSVDCDNLTNELQQLGLQKDTSFALSKIYNENSDRLAMHLKDQSLRLSRFIHLDWRVDYIISSSMISGIYEPSFELSFQIERCNHDNEIILFTISREKFRTILAELKQAFKALNSAN